MESITFENKDGEMVEITKNLILGYIEDEMLDFMVYDRENDEDMPFGAIEAAVDAGIVTFDEMVDRFKQALEDYIV